jgi:hypothetical protein
MPILDSEPDMFPDNLLDSPVPAEVGDASWWAIYTRSRREKELMRRLRRQEVPFYAPVIGKQYRSPAGRLRTSYIPLFANYVFLFGSEADRQQALTSGCVSRCLPVPDPITLVHDLRQLRQVIQAGVDLTPEGRLEVGTLIRVKSGPMAGVVGTVVERRGKKRLLVMVNFLQQGASVEVQDLDVEPFTA